MSVARICAFVLGFGPVLALAGCAATRHSQVHSAYPPVAVPVAVVFIANGAGNFQATTTAIQNVVSEDMLPLNVHTFDWSHGNGRILADQMGYEYSVEQGQRMAGEVMCYHALHPGTRIHVCGHSAGCLVAVKAVESLPAGVVDRLILLSPSLSVDYDIRPSLERVGCGVYVFHSRHDCLYLGMFTCLLGTSDRLHQPTSGRFGFAVDPSALDPALRGKLYQRAWQPDDQALGNKGGHFGNYQAAFLRAHVIPLLY
jgi:pimeloyl-ACP methyl ester carboxylesterase